MEPVVPQESELFDQVAGGHGVLVGIVIASDMILDIVIGNNLYRGLFGINRESKQEENR
jgi:hypothetical protein